MRTSKIVSVDSDKTLIKGLNSNFTQKTSFVLNGEELSVAQIVAALNGRVAAAADSTAKEIAWRAAVKTEREKDEAVQPLRQALKAALVSRYGSDAQELKEFSFPPAKERKVSVKTKAKAQEQSIATRAARMTMGKKQKKGIKGVVAEPQTTSDSDAPATPTRAAASAATTASSTPTVNAGGASNGQTSS
jgi:hypothetical protein